MMLKKFLLLLAICHMSYTISGCGYTTRSLITNQYKTIYVAPFLNKIDITLQEKTSSDYQLYRPLLETDITRAVINRFVLDGNLRIAKEESADLLLKGALLDYRRDVLRYETDETPEEYRISLIVEVNCRQRDQDKLLWKENIIGDTTYFLSGPNAKSEPAAINDVTADLARRIVERIVENW